MKPRLIILGATARAAAQSALRAGLTPLAADLFADADLAAAAQAVRIDRYPDQFLDVFPEVDAPWIYTGALENHPGLLQQLGRNRALLGNPAEIVRRVRDPWQLAQVLASSGFVSPPIRQVVAATDSGGWLRKPLRSAAGLQIRFARQTDCPEAGFYYQQHVPGAPCSSVYLGGPASCLYLGSTRQLIGCPWAGARDFQYCGSVGPLPLAPAIENRLGSLGGLLQSEFKLRGLFGVDFVLDDQQIWILEVNPRYSASVEVLEAAAGVRALDLHVRSCRGEELPWRVDPGDPDGSPTRCHGKAIVFASRAFPVTAAVTEFLLSQSNREFDGSFADIPNPGQTIAAGSPIATIFARGPSVDDTIANLRAQVGRVVGP